MSDPSGTERPSSTDAADIQGNLVGFNKDHLRMLFLTFSSTQAGQQLMSSLADEVNTAEQVRQFNSEFRELIDSGGNPLTLQSSWVNVLLPAPGLALLGADGLDSFPAEFVAGMRARASVIGDVDGSDPANWVGPFDPSVDFALHAVVIIAADSADLLDQRTASVRTLIQSSGATEFSTEQEGQTRPAPFTGHEHFGFKDGISQPSILGLTRSSKGGADIAAGQFLIGYQDQDGNVSGQPIAPPAQPGPGQPGYPAPTPPPPPAPLPPWCRNGSFVVYRRLRQDVAGFENFLANQAGSVNLTGDQLAARMVGRWPSGAPLENVPGDPGVDATLADPSTSHPSVLEPSHINDFGYLEHDPSGSIVPTAAHIRKTNPRDSEPPGQDESNRHRIARRGIPYGPEVVPTEPPYGQGPVPDTQDRGLLFLCYQASIADGFEFIQSSWANTPTFPNPDSGQDPIISQNTLAPPFPLPANPHLTTNRWVTTTGGAYLFSPSVSALRHLAGQT